MDKNLQTLELDKVLALLAEQTTCDDAKEAALALRPAADPGEIALLLDQTEDAFSMLARFGAPSFGGLHNVNGPLQRAAAGGCLNMTELLQVGDTLRALRILDDWHGHLAGTSSSLNFFFDGITVNKYLENRIFTCIVSPEEMADKASEELYDIRRKIKAKAAAIRQRLDGMIHSTHYQKFLQEPIVTQRGGRFVVPVKAEHRGEVPGLVHDTSSSGATVFIEPAAVVDANNDIKVLEGREREEVQRILFELSAEAGTFAESVRHSYDSAVRLNLIFAKAHLAYQMKAARPQLNTEGVTDLKNARHPLIDKERVVPVHITLGTDYDTLVITGPNTGGKTVTLKTIGLLSLMAQCGLHIPAGDQSAVQVFSRILADVGDEQSIEQSLSTFSAHMANTVEILKQADDRSLILFDELGAGTDPVEGAALAIAIIQDVRGKGALTAATTHYAELKTFAMTTAGVENASCEFDVQTLRPTYRLLIGIPGKSNAFAISRRLGLDESVIETAKAQMDSESVRFEDVLTQLEEKRQRLEKAQTEADRLWQQREEDARKARIFREQMEKAKDNARTKGEAEAKRIVRQAQAQADEIFAQLDQLRRQQQKQLSFQELNDAKAAVRHSLNQAQDALHIHDQPQEPVYTPSRPIEVGDLVELPGVKMAASVLAVNNDGTLLLQAGKMKMTVKAQQVRLPEGQPKKKPAAPASGGSAKLNLQSRAASELDIRGYETLEAESVVENYIDSAVMAKLGTVTIIHGKGTGALRKAVHEMLKRNKAVKSFRLGRYGEGEAGVTVVELK